MQSGQQLVLDLGSELPDLKRFDSAEFPICKLLNSHEFAKPAISGKIIAGGI